MIDNAKTVFAIQEEDSCFLDEAIIDTPANKAPREPNRKDGAIILQENSCDPPRPHPIPKPKEKKPKTITAIITKKDFRKVDIWENENYY